MDKNIVKSQFNNIYDNRILLIDFTGQGELCENYSTLIVSSKMFITVPINITGEVHFSNNYVDWNIKVNLNLGETSEDTKNRFITVKGKYFRVLLSSSNTELESTYLETSLSKVHIDKYSDDGNDVDMNDSLNTINSSVETLDTSIGSSNTKLDAVNTNINTLDSNNNSNFITVNSKLDMNNNFLNIINSTNTGIKNSVNIITNNYIDNDLKYLRNQGRCFILGTQHYHGSNEQKRMLGIYNDDVTKRVFIYSINLTVSGGDTNARIRGELEFFNNDVPKSGTNITPINIKVGETTNFADNIYCQKDYQYSTKIGDAFTYDLAHSGTSTMFDLQEEYIELPKGYGLGLNINFAQNTPNSGASIRFFVVDV